MTIFSDLRNLPEFADVNVLLSQMVPDIVDIHRGRYPDRIPQDKIPQDKIPQDRIPQDKIPQPEKWTKSHNIESWQGDGFKTALVNWLQWQTLLCCIGLEGFADYFSKTYVTWTFRYVQPSQPTVRLESTCSWCRHVSHGWPELWNVHEATVNGAPLTNNQCEGWNNITYTFIWLATVCRLASSRSVRIVSGSSWPASGTTFAGIGA